MTFYISYLDQTTVDFDKVHLAEKVSAKTEPNVYFDSYRNGISSAGRQFIKRTVSVRNAIFVNSVRPRVNINYFFFQ